MACERCRCFSAKAMLLEVWQWNYLSQNLRIKGFYTFSFGVSLKVDVKDLDLKLNSFTTLATT